MTLTAFRLDVELLERIDRFAEQLTAETGIPVQRAEAARQLLEAGLRAREKRTNRKGPRGPASDASSTRPATRHVEAAPQILPRFSEPLKRTVESTTRHAIWRG